jgi:hypothetical protein
MFLTKKTPEKLSSANNSHGAADASGAVDADALLEPADAAVEVAEAAEAIVTAEREQPHTRPCLKKKCACSHRGSRLGM